MLLFKSVPITIFLLATSACTTGAEKKIELQDIEEDNLKSEKEKGQISEVRSQNANGPGRDLLPLEFLKNGLLRYFESPQVPQQPRFVHQYSVNEQPEKQSVAQQTLPQKGQYAASAPQQAMVGYLSNVPMQIYLIPQYYGEQPEQSANVQHGVQYAPPAVARGYPTAPEAAQPQTNYIEVPSYATPTGKSYIAPQYTPQITYVTYAQQPALTPNAHVAVVTPGPSAPQATTAPMVTYAMPILQYPPSTYAKPYYPNYGQTSESNAIEEAQETEIEGPKHYAAQPEISYVKSAVTEYPRYYTSRAPIREEQRHHPVQELPPPSPLLFRSQPSHLAGLPKALPMFRPLNKPVYSAPGNVIPGYANIPRPNEAYGIPKRRPTSLLDSYIPSSVQLEYLKRGYVKDPLSVYDVLSSGRSYPHVTPNHLERGFLPNQMYHTAAGGVTYGHYKRTPKSDKPILKA